MVIYFAFAVREEINNTHAAISIDQWFFNSIAYSIMFTDNRLAHFPRKAIKIIWLKIG